MCVRLTDLRGVDLDTFSFDHDQTFALLLLASDGRTVLHRYGQRDAASPTSAMSEASLLRLLKEGLTTFEQRRASGAKAPTRAPRTLDDNPAWQRKVAERERRKQPIGCYHCHFVHDAELVHARDQGTWRPEMIWRWPEPARVGLELDPVEQERVVLVREGTPAARAGLRAGDRLLAIDGARVLTWNDVSAALERSRGQGPVKLSVRVRRGDAEVEVGLELPAGFEVATFKELAWRPSKWMLRPTPGFGGPDLSKEERTKLGLPADGLAFRVSYFADWNDEAPYARVAKAAGVGAGDVVVAVGDSPATRVDEVHAWWRLVVRPGDELKLVLLRDGERVEVRLTVPR